MNNLKMTVEEAKEKLIKLDKLSKELFDLANDFGKDMLPHNLHREVSGIWDTMESIASNYNIPYDRSKSIEEQFND